MDPIVVLADGHFGGPLALWSAVFATAAPAVYVASLLIGSRILRRDPRVGLWCAAVLVIGFSFALLPYWGRYLSGVNEVGEVVGFETKSANRVSNNLYEIKLSEGRFLREFVEPGDQSKMVVGQRVVVTGIEGLSGFERLGDGATLGEGTLFGSLFAWGALGGMTAAFARARREPERDDD